MIYKTYKCNSFNVYTIKTDRFKTAHLEIQFRKKAVKEEMGKYAFLADALSESTKNYPRRKDLIIKFEELYKSICYASTIRTGNVLTFNVSLDFINPKYINKDNYLESVIKIVLEMLQNPNVTNDEFDLKTFNIVKDRIERELNSLKENPVKQSIKKAFETMGGDTPTTFELLGTREELEKLTPGDLYKAYKKLFKDFVCDVFVIGDFDMDEFVTILKKYFKNRYINEEKFNFLVDNKETKKEHVGSLDSDNVQASLVMIYNTNNLDKIESNITMHVFNYLFGNGGLTCKLYQSLREKNSLCYAISSMYLKYDGLLLIQVSLEQENVKKAISLIKKELKAMQLGDFKDEEVKDAINNMIVSLDLAGDNNIAILNNYVFNCLDDLPLLEERKELFKKVTKDDVVKVAKKIKINTIFTLNGKENNHE